jgi:acyl-homoserine-lactone acylase
MMDAALAFARARSVDDMRQAHAGLGLPWVNTLAADRHGRVLYADVSVVPDVDAAQLERCAPSKPAAALRWPPGWWCSMARGPTAPGNKTAARPFRG